MDTDRTAVAALMADVAAAVSRQAAAVHEDVYEVILREIPQLRDDQAVLALLASGVDSNVDTVLRYCSTGSTWPPCRPRRRPWNTRAGWPSAPRR